MAKMFRDPPPLTGWKPGDRFTIEHEVLETYDNGDIRTVDRWWFDFQDMARAVKLPPKARPVRKGDEVRLLDVGDLRTFIAYHEGRVYLLHAERDKAFHSNPDYYAHADGTPIDWEASE